MAARRPGGRGGKGKPAAKRRTPPRPATLRGIAGAVKKAAARGAAHRGEAARPKTRPGEPRVIKGDTGHQRAAAALMRARAAAGGFLGPDGSDTRLALLVGTRKGAFILIADAQRRRFALGDPHFLGANVHHLVIDPRDGRTLLAAARPGRGGPTVYRSSDLGRSWKESSRPPAFPRIEEPSAASPGVSGTHASATAWGPARASEVPLGAALAAGTAAGPTYDPAALYETASARPSWDLAPAAARPDPAARAADSSRSAAGAPPSSRAVEATFWLTPGHATQSGVWWAGTMPSGLFRSTDDGDTWEGIDGFNRNPMRQPWEPPYFAGTPEGPITHSILIDPRDARHLYVGLSTGGLFETWDMGATWSPLNRGVAADFLPEGSEYGHDPHSVALHPRRPDRLYQANRCGLYRLDRPAESWVRIGQNMPQEVGDIGFPIVLHPRDPDTAWIVPMDGSAGGSRTSPGGRPAVYRTRDAGATWERQDHGLPREHAWFTVKRQAMASDSRGPVGLYFGTTGGEIWMSGDEGATWRSLVSHLPQINSIVAAEVPAALAG